jgi:hypothetical protein
VATPHPDDGQVLIEVAACAVTCDEDFADGFERGLNLRIDAETHYLVREEIGKGVTDLVASAFDISGLGVSLRPRFGLPRVAPSCVLLPTGVENTPRNRRAIATSAPASRRKVLVRS